MRQLGRGLLAADQFLTDLGSIAVNQQDCYDKLGQTVYGKVWNMGNFQYYIHRPAPPLVDQATSAEVLPTGIKVIDLICPFLKGGKVGAFGGAGVGKTVVIMGVDQQYRQTPWRRVGVRGRRGAHS